MNEQNNSINGLMKSLQDQLNGESTTQKVDVQQNQISNQQGGTLPGEAALASVDAHNTSINAVQQNDFTNGAATALLQTIINQSSSEILSDNNAAKGGAPGAMDPQYTLPDLHELGGALQQNGTIHTQQNPSYVINSDSNYNTDQGQTVTVVDQGFCHSVASENPNNLQTFLVNQTPNSDLHVITENHLNQVNLSTFEGLAQVNAKVLDSSECLSDKPVLEQLLTDRKLSDNISSPELQNACSPTSSANSPYTEANGQETSFIDHASQGLTYTEMAPMTIDTSTQSSLIARSEKLVLVDSPYQGATVIEDKDKNIAWDVTKIDDHELEQIGKPKMMKLGQDNDAPSSVLSPSVERVFESAMQGLSPEFTFHKFGQIDADQGFFQFGAEKKELEGPSSPPITFKTPHPPGYGARLQSALKARKREQARRSREPILSQQFPPRHQNYELKILSQPEEQHRARYLTEGSRGAVKNRSGQSYPSVKLLGHSGEATLQVFVGNDSGRVRPHGFYQACKVCGKNSTPCHEKDIDGTTVIEIDLKSSNDMTAAIDCVGILKLRNADVEQRIGLAKAKKKSTKARMVFRVTFQKPCGSPQVLQVASAPILCTQPIGQPEICKMSLKECSSSGGEELYVIGKNFLRGTRVFFQEVNEEDKCLWEGEGEIDKDYFQTTHMIVTIPEYGHSLQPGCKVQCQVVANSGGKVSDPQSFTYRADELKPAVKQEVIPMDISEESRKRNYPFVAPEALELNQQIQQTSQSSELFQMPPGVLSGVIQQQNNNNTTNTHTNMEEAKTYQSPPQQTHIPETVTETEQLNLNTVGYSVNPNMFNTDTMSNTQTQAWENKPTEPAKGYTTMESESAEGIFPMNTDENYTDQTFESSLNRIKSPRMSTDTYQTEHGLTSSIFSGESVNMNTSSEISSGDNMINQLLQNLHDSDPMLGSSSHNASANPAGQSLGQTSGTYFSAGPNSSGTQKPEDQQCSRLKEALTCPPSSLQEFSNFANIANSNLAVAPDTTHNACDSVVMNEADKDKMNASFTASPHQNATFSPSQSVYSPEQAVPSPTTNGALQTSFNQVEQNVPSPATSIMFQTSFPQQSDMTASVTYSTAPSSTQLSSQGLVVNSDNTNTQSINTSDQFSQLFNNVVNSATLHTPLIQEGSLQQSGTQLPVSHGVTSTTSNIVTQSQQVYHNNQSIGFSSPQQQQLQAAAAHLSSQSSESIVINPANPSNHNVSSGTTLTAIQQLLQQSVHQSLQQQPQISQQMGANQIGVLTSAQTNIVPSPQAALQAQPLYPAQTNFGLSTQASAAAQTPPSSAQTQNSAPVLQTQTPAFTPAPATSNQTGFTSSTPSIPQKAETFNTTGSVQPPVAGPQIIICNPGQQPAQPTTGFGGAPSIVIMPAQNGQNNQVESLLRSILGSMMGQPQQSQQQQQQTQPPANQQ